jgi:hypothetical protein
MRDVARNVPSWDRCHETASVRRLNTFGCLRRGQHGACRRYHRGVPRPQATPRGTPRLAAHGGKNRRGRPDRAGGQAGSASAPGTRRRAESNTHDERYARRTATQRMAEAPTGSDRRPCQRPDRRLRPKSRLDSSRTSGDSHTRVPRPALGPAPGVRRVRRHGLRWRPRMRRLCR